jgi:predicted RNA-binding protein with PIN domain
VPILVDGHNLIGRLANLSLQDPHDEEKLVTLLRSYRARTGKKITVVFDPGTIFALSQSRREGGIEVVYAPPKGTADAIIARRVRRSPDPHGWLVITSDSDLAATVARLGARVKSSDAFAQELGAQELGGPASPEPDWKDQPPSAEEVDDWLSLFEARDDVD